MGFDWSQFPPKNTYKSATPASLQELYSIQKSDASYQKFLLSNNNTTFIFGTIDDHDYGMNNGDMTFEYKVQSATSFLDFIEVDRNSVMYQRAQKGLGVYGVKVFDFSKEGDYVLSDEEAGIDADLVKDDFTTDEYDDRRRGKVQNSDRTVAIFVLDVRSNKTPWPQQPHPNYDGDFLGEIQWKWLETTIRRSHASVNIIVSGLQVHPYRMSKTNELELWSSFPASRQRLYDTILQEHVRAPMLISGDVHMSQFMRKDCLKKEDMLTEKEHHHIRPLVEFTFSGMTHSWGTCFGCNQKLHHTWKYYPCHMFSNYIMVLIHAFLPMPDVMNSNDNHLADEELGLYTHGGTENAKKGTQYSLQLNFGEMEFDWKKRMVKVRTIGKDLNASPLLSATFGFDQLSGNEPMNGNKVINIERSMKYGKFAMDGNVVDDGLFVCINHRGTTSPIFVNIGFAFIGVFGIAFFLIPICLVFYIIKWICQRQKAPKQKKE